MRDAEIGDMPMTMRMGIATKTALWAAGTIVYYLIVVFLLLIMSLTYGDSFDSIWLSSIPVTTFAQLLLLGFCIWKKLYIKMTTRRRA